VGDEMLYLEMGAWVCLCSVRWVFCRIGVCIGVSRVICALGSIDLLPRPVPESGAFLPFYSLRSTKSSKWWRWLFVGYDSDGDDARQTCV
jgi:hypothetical protein